jgi:hypothetical protein
MLSSPAVKPRFWTLAGFAKWVALAACGLLALVIVLGVGGVQVPWPATETTQQKPYADFVGREYRVTSDVSAYAWNDFPDKAKILSITLMPPPGVRNRFVSYVTPLQPGQRVRIISAWRHFLLLGFHRYYVVSVPDAGLPEGIEITMSVNSDGVPDPHVYEPIDK